MLRAVTEKYTIDEVLLTHCSWLAMRRRCSGKSKNPLDIPYASLEIHEEWKSDFHAFMRDLGPRPSALYTLDRFPDKSKGYIPGNVRWANKTEQAVNRKSTKFILCEGVEKPISHWAKEKGLSRSTIRRRLDEGMSPKEAMSRPGVDITQGFVDGLEIGKQLSRSQVDEILQKARSGEASLTELTRQYNVSTGCILNLTKKFGVQIVKKYNTVKRSE